jgi:hypothetical protein
MGRDALRRTGASLVAPVPHALRLDAGAGDQLAPHGVELSQAFDRTGDFDLVHCHVDYLAFPFSRLVATPTVHTLHERLDLPHTRAVLGHFDDVPLRPLALRRPRHARARGRRGRGARPLRRRGARGARLALAIP